MRGRRGTGGEGVGRGIAPHRPCARDAEPGSEGWSCRCEHEVVGQEEVGRRRGCVVERGLPVFFGGDVAGGALAVFAQAACGELGGDFFNHGGVAAEHEVRGIG